MAPAIREQLLHALQDTQSTAQALRQQAELSLRNLRFDSSFPKTLAEIACHDEVPLPTRQAALSSLRLFVSQNWSGAHNDEGPAIIISGNVKQDVRDAMLQLAFSADSERKVKVAASHVVSKIALANFPDDWPSLLPITLKTIQDAEPGQLYGAMIVLTDLVQDNLSDEKFFSVARPIVATVYSIASNQDQKPVLRALAIKVFRACFDIMDTIKDDSEVEVKEFAEETLTAWAPLFMAIIQMPLPERDTSDITGEPDSWRGIMSVKVQAIQTLFKIRTVFPSALLNLILPIFSAVWAELMSVRDTFEKLYINNDVQGRLEDADGLPYTLDFLILEELDFLQSCLSAPPVRQELTTQIQSSPSVPETPFLLQMMQLTIALSRITCEDEGMWDVDVSLYLAEEAAVTGNYTARTACGDFLVKVGEWLKHDALLALLHATMLSYGQSDDWKTKESSMFLLTTLMNDFHDTDTALDVACAPTLVALITETISAQNHPLLRARGYLVAGVLVQGLPTIPETPTFLTQTIQTANNDESDVVKVACFKAIQSYVEQTTLALASDWQIAICQSIGRFIESRDMTELEDQEDLMMTLVETLRFAININPRISLTSSALDLLFLLARHGGASYHILEMVNETFEEVAEELSSGGLALYSDLCAKVVPTLIGAFDVGALTEDDTLTVLATELLATLCEHAPASLPDGFVASVMPKLNRLLMTTVEGDILRPGTEVIKYMLQHDSEQIMSWQDNGKSGLEVCLIIIDRLLSPEIEDNAASEVGGLAVAVVEKAGAERLGQYLPQLLQAVACRLASAEKAPFIQSLVLVFARLSRASPHDVISFLAQLDIGGQNGLEVVMSKWLENSTHFAGYEEIRENVLALSNIYGLNDPLLSRIMLRGDLIIPTSTRIMTRSRTKNTPDQYTTVSAQLKIVKVLIEELLSASGAQSAAAAAAAAELAEEDDDEGWEDVPNVLDLGLASAKRDLMEYGNGDSLFPRQHDDETQTYLTQWFVKVGEDNIGNFKELYSQLTDAEKAKLSDMARTG